MLVLHIGYPKTATTYLQRSVFPNWDGLNYVGRFYDVASLEAKTDLAQKFVFDKFFRSSYFVSRLNRNGFSDDKINLYSSEIFLRPGYVDQAISRMLCLQESVGDLKIIVSIRNQADLFLSRFLHDQRVITVDFEEFDSVLDYYGDSKCTYPVCNKRFKKCKCRKIGRKVISLPFHDYNKLRVNLSSSFGAENIHFIVSEGLRDTPDRELGRLQEFLCLDSPPSNKMLNLEQNVQKDKPKYNELRQLYECSGMKAKIRNYFSLSNKELAEFINVPLGKYGYY